MPAAKVIDFVVPSNTPEGKGKGIIVARFSNAAGVVPDNMWDLFIKNVTNMMTTLYSQLSPALIELSMDNITEEDTDLFYLPDDIQSQLGQGEGMGVKQQGGLPIPAELMGQLLVSALTGDGKQIKNLLVKTFGQEKIDGLAPEARAALDAMASGKNDPETLAILEKARTVLTAQRAANAAVKQASAKVPRDLQAEVDKIVGTAPNFTRH